MLSGLRNDMIYDRGLFSKLQKIKLLSLIKSFKLKSRKNILCQKFTCIWPFQMAQRLSSYLLSGKSPKNVTLLVWFKTLCSIPSLLFRPLVECQCSQVFLGRYRQFLKNLSPISPHANIARNRQNRHKSAQFRHKFANFLGHKMLILVKFPHFSIKNC